MTEAIALLMSQGAWSEAKVESERIIAQMPTSADAHAYLGLCHYHDQLWPAAIQSFERAVSLNPKYWQAGLKIAQCLDRMTQFEQACEVAKYWQTVHPGDACLNALVQSLRRYERQDSADGWQRSKYKPDHHVTVTH